MPDLDSPRHKLWQEGAGQDYCQKHGNKYIDWKCNYCCSVARYQASSKLYLCERCHDNYPNSLEIEDCNGVFCPIGMPHPPVNHQHVNDIAYPLGCGLCRSHRLTEKLYGK